MIHPLPDEIPEKQGLKRTILNKNTWQKKLPDEIPEKQGLKQKSFSIRMGEVRSPGRNSRKTRIETNCHRYQKGLTINSRTKFQKNKD